MNRLEVKKRRDSLRALRVRAKAKGTTERPRLSITISNVHVSAQVINDELHKTLAHATTIGSKSAKGTMTEKAVVIGAEIAKAAKAAKVTKVVFDRGSRVYHGRIKALADAARAAGLEF